MERISQLLYKHLSGTLSQAEHEELMAWVAAHPDNLRLFEQANDGNQLDTDLEHWLAIPKKTLADDFRLQAEVAKHERRLKVRRLRRWLPYAAAVMIALAVGIWFLDTSDQRSGIRHQSLDGRLTADVAPGGNRATLTLADGQTIDLSDEQAGIVVGDGVTYLDGSSVLSKEVNTGANEVPHTLTTPKGGTYQVKLPDGSRVWLNAASTLKYPGRFNNKERVVYLTGEAYFDVEPAVNGNRGRLPFRVITDSQTVEVLGTEFNITAYPDDRETKTTLVTGSVQVAAIPAGAPLSTLLIPGQQASTRGSTLEVNDVDVFDYTAWRDGIIVLNSARLSDVIRQIERWYDVTIEFLDVQTSKTAYVMINRNENLSSVLKALEETYHVKLKLEGRRVSVID